MIINGVYYYDLSLGKYYNNYYYFYYYTTNATYYYYLNTKITTNITDLKHFRIQKSS